MNNVVIKAENIGKKYTIGHQAERGGYTALRDVLMQNAQTLWNKTKDLAMGKPIIQGDTMEEVWALKDVSFEIRRGEAVEHSATIVTGDPEFKETKSLAAVLWLNPPREKKNK